MRIITITISLTVISSVILAQSNEDISNFLHLNEIEENSKDYEIAKENNDEFDLLFSSLFLFYKNFISSQDIGRCSFTPSCSEYAIEAVKKQGSIAGIINFFDRFSRCNGFSPEHYEKDLNLNLLLDPVRDINHEFPE